MHQKHHHLIIATYALLVLAAPLIWADGAHAQTSCPAGYTCTPAPQTTFSNGYYWGNTSYTNSNSAYTVPVQTIVPVVQTTNTTAGNLSSSNSTACYQFNTDMTMGSQGSAVSVLQAFLIRKGYSLPSPTGYFGMMTANALKSFQSANGINENGFFGPVTRAKVNAIIAADNGSQCSGTTPVGSVTGGSPNGGTSFPSMTPSQQTISSGQTVQLSFVYPANTMRASLYIACPLGVTVGGTKGNVGDCNTEATLTGSQSALFQLLNTTNTAALVVVKYIVYTSDNSYAPKIVTSNVTVLPAASSGSTPITTTLTPMSISWTGGSGRVQIGLVDSRFEANGTILGWMSLTSMPNSSFVWNNGSVGDLAGTVTWQASSLSSGPFRVIAVSQNSSGAYCMSTGCNYALSSPFSSLSARPSSISLVLAGVSGTVTFNGTPSTVVTGPGPIQTTPTTPAPYTPPVMISTAKAAVQLSVSAATTYVGTPITITANGSSPYFTLVKMWTDISTDNATWTSNAPCAPWSGDPMFGYHTLTCTFTPSAVGTYYIRASANDNHTNAEYSYQTVKVIAKPATITSYTVSPAIVPAGGTFVWSGAATQGTYPIARYRAYVVGSTRPASGGWTTASNGNSVSFSAQNVSTAQNPASFYSGPGIYTLKFEVEDTAGNPPVYQEARITVQ